MAEVQPEIERLVPHRGAALFLDRILAWDPGSIECVGHIPPDNACVSDGFAASFSGLELAAQAAAALEALLRRRSGLATWPLIGYLVSVKEARFQVARLPAGAELETRVLRVGSAPPLATYEIRVLRTGVECVFAILSIYAAPVPSKPSAEGIMKGVGSLGDP